MNKPLKITLIVFASLLAFFIIVSLLVSPIAKKYVNNHGEDLIGRKIGVDRLRVNLYNGSVKIGNLSVKEDDGTTDFLTFDTLDVSVKLRKLLAHEVYVRHITLSGLDVNVIQDGSRFNFTSILDHFAPDPDKEPDTTASEPWALGFYNIRLSHWHVYYADRKQGSEWKLKDLNIEVPGVYFSGEESTDAGLSLALADGGQLNTQVRYTMETNDFDVKLKLTDFAISNVKAYLTDVMNISTMEGTLGANLRAKGNLSHLLDMGIDGTVNLDGTDIRDRDGQPVLQCANIAVDVNNIVISQNRFDIKSVLVDGLSSRFDRYKTYSNFSRLFAVAAKPAETETDTAGADNKAEADTAAKAEAKPFNLTVGRFILKDASFTYADHTLPDPFSFPVTKINVQADNVNLLGNNAAHIFAALPHGGHAVIDWQGSLDDIKRSQNLRLDIKNLRLQDLSPYSVAYLGQPFTDGTFSFTSHNTINRSELNGDNHIDIYKPEVGDRRKDVDSTLRLPLKAALYVLKDKNDKVRLDVPVSGNIDSPEFNYMKLVWKTLGNLVVKVATSPARKIADAMGLGSSNLDFLPFDPDQTDFTSEQYYVMEQLAQVAGYDSNVVILMEQQIAESVPDSTIFDTEKRNEAVRRHFEHLGVRPNQVQVSTASARGKKTGYNITSTLLEADGE